MIKTEPFVFQGIQKKRFMVLFTLDNWDSSVLSGYPECIYWFKSLPRKDIKKHKNLDYTFHCSGIFDCVVIPFPRQMGLHTEARSGFRQWTTDRHSSRNLSGWQTEWIEGWVMLRKMNQCINFMEKVIHTMRLPHKSLRVRILWAIHIVCITPILFYWYWSKDTCLKSVEKWWMWNSCTP